MTDRPIVNCDCEGFKKSFDQIQGAQELAWFRGWRYTGRTFEYCPWCGKKFDVVEEIDERTYD